MSKDNEAFKIIAERFGRDTLVSLATIDKNRPFVRIVNGYYENGLFYVITYKLSNKMKQIKKNPEVAVCGEWFTANGIGKNIGHVLNKKNTAVMAKLREVFAEWYSNGHVNEDDVNTCILCIKLTKGVLFNQGKKYNVNFDDMKL
ncbi:pyridoxamine 5'-phosphate oxidase family protein [Treponema sp. R80B11-R83G3]